MDLKDNVQMTALVPAGGLAREDILVRVLGNLVTLGKAGSYLGTFLAPNANVTSRKAPN